MTSFGVPILPSHEILTSAGANKTVAERRTCRSWIADIAPVASVSSLILTMSAIVSVIDQPRYDLGLSTRGSLREYRRAVCSPPDESE